MNLRLYSPGSPSKLPVGGSDDDNGSVRSNISALRAAMARQLWNSEEIPVWEVSRSHLLMPEIGSTGCGVCFNVFFGPLLVLYSVLLVYML